MPLPRRAAILLRDAPDKLWRRIGCIVFEDVGVASLQSVGLAMAALGESKLAPRLAASGRSPAALSPNFAERQSAGRPTIS